MAESPRLLAGWLSRKYAVPSIASAIAGATLYAQGQAGGDPVDPWLAEALPDDSDEIADLVWSECVERCEELRRSGAYDLVLHDARGKVLARKTFRVDWGMSSASEETDQHGQVANAQRHAEAMASKYIDGVNRSFTALERTADELRKTLAVYSAREQELVRREQRLAELAAQLAAAEKRDDWGDVPALVTQYLSGGGMDRILDAVTESARAMGAGKANGKKRSLPKGSA